MIRVASSQYAYRFGDQLHFPYSIGVLVSYLKSLPEFENKLELLPTAVDRPDLKNDIEIASHADIILCSCYSWNWEITKTYAESVKKKNPNCWVICGGPQLPDDCSKFFSDHWYVDFVVHHEGEIPLANILRKYISGESPEKIPSVSTPANPSWMPEKLIKEMSIIKSPYLDNTIYDLVDKSDEFKWIVTWETVRGCPYACSYCAWGKSAYDTVRRFDLEKLYKEIDWMSDNKIEYIDCADANFGMFERDMEITQYIKKKKIETGYPITFKPSWAKKVTPRLLDIAKELKSVDLLTSVGCSLQSLDKETLKINKRKSVSYDEFLQITGDFNSEGTQCFTEIIRGLPGETVQTFQDGLDKVILDSPVNTVYIYNCSSLENTDLDTPEFRDQYKVVTQRSPLYFGHASLYDNDIIEHENLLVSSFSFTRENMEEMYMQSWYMLAFHHLGILNYIIKYLKKEYGVEYSTFHQKFKNYCIENPNSLFGKEYFTVKDYVKKGYAGEGWNHIDMTLGPINWPVDEATWLRVTDHKFQLYEETSKLCKYILNQNNINLVLADLIGFQGFTTMDRLKTHEEYINWYFDYDWVKYWKFGGPLSKLGNLYKFKNKIVGAKDDFDWNTKAIWFGRRKLNFKATLEEIEYGQ